MGIYEKKSIVGMGVFQLKTRYNYGSLFRTAQLMDVDFLFLIGTRFKKQSSDTMCSYRHIPVYEYNDFQDFQKHRPYNVPLVGVEMTKNSQNIISYKHQKNAIYLLGAEDNGLSRECINHCQEIIRLPGEFSMNVAVACSIVLYDRHAKKNCP